MSYLTTSMIRPLVKAVCDLAYVLKGNGKPSDDEPMDYEVIAELFYGLYGDEAIEKIEQVLEKAGAVEKAWNASDHPRGKNGRFIPKGSAEAVSSAQEAVRKVLKGDYSVKPQEIADHLSILTMKQIRALAAEHGRKVPRVLKADLIESVKALVGQPAESKAEAPRVEPKQTNQADDDYLDPDFVEEEEEPTEGKEDWELTREQHGHSPHHYQVVLTDIGFKDKVSGLQMLDVSKIPYVPDDIRRLYLPLVAGDSAGKKRRDQLSKLREARDKLTDAMQLAADRGGRYGHPFKVGTPAFAAFTNYLDAIKKFGETSSDAQVWASKARRETNEFYEKVSKEYANGRLVGDVHHHLVETALLHGKPVPDKVLADYPDLAEKYKSEDTGKPAADATTPDAKGGEVSDNGGSVEQVSDKPKDAPAESAPPAKPDPVINREVDEILNSHTQWHSDYALPKKSANRLVDDILRRGFSLSGGNRYVVYARAITDQGWATEGHYVVRATPKMIEYAQSKGVQDLPGYVPNVNDILPKKRGEHASIIGGRRDEYGRSVLLFQADNKHQTVADSEYVSAVTSLYPKADWEMHDHSILVARQDGEIVGLEMGFDTPPKPGDKHYVAEVKGERRTLADRMQPGPYSSTDVVDEGGRFVVGRGTPDELAVRITGSAKSGFSLQGGNLAFPAYATVSEAKNAAKEILSYVHGKAEDGTFIFKPKGEESASSESNARESRLSPEAKRHRDYYANLREKAKSKPVRKEKIELEDDRGNKYERELAYVGDHFAVHEALPEWKRGKPVASGYTVRLPGQGKTAGTFKNKTDAIKFAHILEVLPGVDWSIDFDKLKEEDLEKYNSLVRRLRNVNRAFEDNEYHPDMGDPERLK